MPDDRTILEFVTDVGADHSDLLQPAPQVFGLTDRLPVQFRSGTLAWLPAGDRSHRRTLQALRRIGWPVHVRLAGDEQVVSVSVPIIGAVTSISKESDGATF